MAGYVPPLTVVLLDSWPGFKDHANILSEVDDHTTWRNGSLPTA